MSSTPSSVRLSANVTPEQAALVEKFRVTERIETRAEAVRLLLEIALDSIAAAGHRFWDKPPPKEE